MFGPRCPGVVTLLFAALPATSMTCATRAFRESSARRRAERPSFSGQPVARRRASERNNASTLQSAARRWGQMVRRRALLNGAAIARMVHNAFLSPTA
ncbi:hypothetical protein V5799_021145 [Amblyomma americanum]|uniref:Secreted protein n=1 Tax=Amblyomma americanum TaxID=6943 RepID=A0AAQ4FR65_AMBAM